jgi:hypothetical protein
MTEQEWLACDYPSPMLEALSDHPDRPKLRLLACHWCLSPAVRRRVTGTSGGREFVAVAERYAAGRASWDELAVAVRAAPRARVSGGYGGAYEAEPVRLVPAAQALRVVAALLADDPWEAAWGVARDGVNLLGSDACDLIRELFGNPFRPGGFDLRWRTADAVALARGIYDDGAFDRLPILADALLDAGCDDEAMLAHCRAAGLHVRGCWVVDAIRTKE